MNIVIGSTTELHFELDDQSDIVVNHVARDNPRPVLIVPDYQPQENETIVVAYDGGIQSSRALHMALLMGVLDKKHKVHVVSIAQDHFDIEKRAQQALIMLKNHDIEAQLHILEKSKSVATVLMAAMTSLDATMLVMGGYSHGSLRETFFGSNTRDILKSCKIPIFLHH